MSVGGPIRVCAVDDHQVVVDGVMARLAADADDIVWLGSANTAEGLRALIRSFDEPPRVALVDLYLQDGSDSSDTIAWLAAQNVAPVLFTSEQRPVPLRRALLAGATAIALKSDDPAGLGDMIRTVAAGGVAYSSDLAFALASDDGLHAHLSPRELTVLDLLAQGLSRRQVARALDIQTSTVDTHVRRVFAAYQGLGRDVSSATGAIKSAREDGYF